MLRSPRNDLSFRYSENRAPDGVQFCMRVDQRCLPMKNRARVPGPEWEPMTAPT